MKKLILIGGVDSIGVPYTKDNKNNQGFFELIEKRLKKEYDLTTINCFHMACYNDNDYITNLITQEKTIEEIKEGQNKMLKKCKHAGVYPYLEIPKSFLNHYLIEKEDKNTYFIESIKRNQVIFIYSAFVNDLLKNQKLSLFKLLRPCRIKQELNNVNITPILKKIEKNIQTLFKLNKEMKIYIVGLFIPTRVSYIRKNLKSLILEINNSLAKLSEKYDNVIFINNENLCKDDFNNIDFHPNKKGHEKIFANFINVYK